jgi:hypothetical protein
MVGTEILGSWAVSSLTASADTAFARLIPPYAGGKGGPYLHKADGNGKRVEPKPRGITTIASLIYAAGGTVHDVIVMRPLNWTYITEAVAANDTTVVVAKDPGTWATAGVFKYDLPGDASGIPSAIGNNTIAANDYVAFQLRDGTWHVSTVASVSSLTVTLNTATPNVTGGGCAIGTMFYYFGVAADTVPQTGAAHLSLKSVASTRVDLLAVAGGGAGVVPALNAGDPLIIYSANATAAGTLHLASGYYLDR